MSKVSKAIAVLGVVAGLGVAAMPLCKCQAITTATKDQPVNVEVLGTISITVTNVAEAGDFDPDTSTLNLGDVIMNGPVVSKSLDVVISSNGPRQVSLSIRDSDSETGLVSGTDVIPAITGTTLAQGDAGWGYKVNDAADWAAITADDVMIVTRGTTSTGHENDAIVPGKNNELHTTVTFGAAANPSIPEGTYTGAVIFTAAPVN